MTQSTSTTPAANLISCAAIYAGDEFMIAIPHREGRLPIRVTSIAFPHIQWVSNDGAAEGIGFMGENALGDHSRAIKELNEGGLLVSSVDDMGDPENSTAVHELVVLASEAGLDGAA